MLQLIRNNTPYAVIILFIFALVFKLQALSHPVMPVALPGNFLYDLILYWLHFLFGSNAFAYAMLALIQLFGQALYLNNIATRRKMFLKPMYNVAYIYIAVTSVAPALSQFSEVLLANWLLLAALDILLGLHQTAQPRKNVFNAGYLLGIAALLHFPAIWLGLMLLMALLLLRTFNPGEWIVSLLGLITPLYFAASILFIIDKFELLNLWADVHFWFPESKVIYPLYTFGTIGGIALLFLAGAFVLQSTMGRTSVFMRRNWTLISFYILISVIVVLTSSKTQGGAWLAAMPPLSLVMVQPLYMEKNKRFSNFIFYFSLALVIFCQLALNK